MAIAESEYSKEEQKGKDAYLSYIIALSSKNKNRRFQSWDSLTDAVKENWIKAAASADNDLSFEHYLFMNLEKNVIDYSLRAEFRDGKVKFYIHPNGKSGTTLDFVVNNNTLSPTNY